MIQSLTQETKMNATKNEIETLFFVKREREFIIDLIVSIRLSNERERSLFVF